MLTDNILKDRTVSQSKNSVRKRQKLGVSTGGKKKQKQKQYYIYTQLVLVQITGATFYANSPQTTIENISRFE